MFAMGIGLPEPGGWQQDEEDKINTEAIDFSQFSLQEVPELPPIPWNDGGSPFSYDRQPLAETPGSSGAGLGLPASSSVNQSLPNYPTQYQHTGAILQDGGSGFHPTSMQDALQDMQARIIALELRDRQRETRIQRTFKWYEGRICTLERTLRNAQGNVAPQASAYGSHANNEHQIHRTTANATNPHGISEGDNPVPPIFGLQAGDPDTPESCSYTRLPEAVFDTARESAIEWWKRLGYHPQTSHCVYHFINNATCAIARQGGKGVACLTCTNYRRPCVRIINGNYVVLPLQESLRQGSEQDAGWWIMRSSAGKSESALWEPRYSSKGQRGTV